MKLPEGKTTETLTGDVEIYRDAIKKFQDENFTGYLLIKKGEGEKEVQGQVVFQNGNGVLSEYLSSSKTASGSESIIPILEIVISGDAHFEIHTSIDVELMIRFFSKAKITNDDLEIEKKIEELKALEEKEKEKTEQMKKELEVRKSLEEKLKKWKMDGYVVTKLEKIFKEPLEKVENEFNEFEEAVKKLIVLDERLSKIESDEYKSNIEEIELKLNNPDHIPEIESELKNLEQLIEEQNQRREELQKIVEQWKKDGYNVSALLDKVEKNASKAWDEFTNVMDTIQKLKEYEETLKNLKAKGFKDRIESLQSKIKDITALNDVKKEYSDLEALLKEEGEKKERLKMMMSSWSEQGYKVDILSEIIEEPFKTAEEKFVEFEKKIEVLKDIKNRLEKIDKTELEKEIKEIVNNLQDPLTAEELSKSMSELETKAEEVKNKKESLLQLLNDLKSQGYNVSELENIFDGKLAIIIEKFEVFEDKKKQLDGIGKELEKLDKRDFPDEIEQIKSKLKDIETIDELKNMLSELQDKNKALDEQKNDIKEKINSLKEEGFIVTKLDGVLEEDFSTLRDTFIAFLDEIQKLKDFQSQLDELSASGHEKEIEFLREKVKDPENLAVVEKSISDLIENITKETERRNEISSQLEKWKEEGYDISQIEAELEKPLDAIEKVFAETEKNITKLKTLGEQLESLDTKWYEEKANEIKEQLQDLGAILDIEKKMAELVDILDKDQRQRKELKDQLERWREEGFNVAMLDNVMDKHIDKISKTAVTLNERINTLQEYESRINSLETKWFEKETVTIKDKLKDPDKIDEITKELEELEEKVEVAKKRRDELKSKYEDWKSQGFNVEPLDNVLDKELYEMEKSFEVFEKDLKQLIELQKKMGVKIPTPDQTKKKEKEKEPEKEKSKEEKKLEAEPDLKEKIKVEEKETIEKPTGEGAAKKEQIISSGMEMIPEFVFDSFVVGASNRFTHAAALAVAESPAEAYNPLFIYGGVGLGKTHLLNAIGNHILNNHRDKNVVYTTSEKFTNELINSIRYDKIEDFRNIYRTADVLIIDDIQFLAGKESTQEEFFHTFNSLYTAHSQIVITSDRPPRDIPQLEERLKSRFEGGLITDIQPPSLETKIIILRREAKKESIDIPDEVMHMIASKVKSNIRELRGALTKIIAYSKLVKQQITEDLAKEVLKDFIGQKPSTRIPPPVEIEEEGMRDREGGPRRVSGGLSSIEKRLSSLKKKLSPILRSEKGEKKQVEVEPEPSAPSEDERRSRDDTGTPAPSPEVGKGKAVAADLETETKAQLESEVAADNNEEEEKLAKCGNCGELLPGTAMTCPNCGVSFADETYECPMCRAIVSADSPRCENCGAEFELSREPPAEEEKKKKKKKKK